MEHLKYPIGPFRRPEETTILNIRSWIKEIELLPQQMQELVNPLDDEQLGLTYRPDSWTIKQVVHHVVDSHINSYVRFKWALTEDTPTIKAYHEGLWAELPDSKKTPVSVSLNLLEALHTRWTILLYALTEKEWKKSIVHPAHGEVDLPTLVAMYAWHGKHHLEHIKLALALGAIS